MAYSNDFKTNYFYREFESRVINGAKRKDKESYRELFSRSQPLPTLETGIKAVIDEANGKIYRYRPVFENLKITYMLSMRTA